MNTQPPTLPTPTTVKEFWTSKQRQGHSLHEISYRACFKPQLPEYFIEQFTQPGDLVVDPFLGRGTTPIQAYLMGRRAAGSDINPLCSMLAQPRFNPPLLSEVESRLLSVRRKLEGQNLSLDIIDSLRRETESDEDISTDDLLVFYHPYTLWQLLELKKCFTNRKLRNSFDEVDGWIRMVCINRLSGHSSGFFSVRTMPPNQAVSVESQRQINLRNSQKPEPRDVLKIVIKKSRSLLRSMQLDQHQLSLLDNGQYEERQETDQLPNPVLETTSADDLSYLDDSSTDLIVTSPPFLNIVDYKKDNWLRCWFAGINIKELKISSYSSIEDWKNFVRSAFEEMCRVTREGGHIAFEVGEIRNGKVQLEETVSQAVEGLPLHRKEVLINQQNFTKTSNLWGISNNQVGTNTNRIVLLQRTR